MRVTATRRVEAGADRVWKVISTPGFFLDHLPAAVRWVSYRVVARPRMRRYLEAVVAGVAYHAETGEPVVRNQFGPHPWFSPAVDTAGRSG